MRRLVDLSVIVCVGLGTAMALAIALSANLISRYSTNPRRERDLCDGAFHRAVNRHCGFPRSAARPPGFQGLLLLERRRRGGAGCFRGRRRHARLWRSRCNVGSGREHNSTLLASRMALANKIRVAPPVWPGPKPGRSYHWGGHRLHRMLPGIERRRRDYRQTLLRSTNGRSVWRTIADRTHRVLCAHVRLADRASSSSQPHQAQHLAVARY